MNIDDDAFESGEFCDRLEEGRKIEHVETSLVLIDMDGGGPTRRVGSRETGNAFVSDDTRDFP